MPKDLVAAILIVGILVLKLKNIDGQMDALLALIVGYYFAHRHDGTDKGQ